MAAADLAQAQAALSEAQSALAEAKAYMSNLGEALCQALTVEAKVIKLGYDPKGPSFDVVVPPKEKYTLSVVVDGVKYVVEDIPKAATPDASTSTTEGAAGSRSPFLFDLCFAALHNPRQSARG